MSWGALYKYDFTNANMLLLLGCDSNVKYVPEDIKTIGYFMKEGGAVVLLGHGGDNPQNKLATRFGVTFKGAAKKPLKAVSHEIIGEIVGRGSWMEFKAAKRWEVLIADADGKPVLARKKVGKGMLISGARGLTGSNPNAKDNINADWWKPLLVKAAQGKTVDAKKGIRTRGLD